MENVAHLVAHSRFPDEKVSSGEPANRAAERLPKNMSECAIMVYSPFMKLPERIKVDPEIMMGKPCVKGTRIPVYVLLQKMAAGETESELLQAYPQLSKADLMAVWDYAARAAAEEIVLTES